MDGSDSIVFRVVHRIDQAGVRDGRCSSSAPARSGKSSDVLHEVAIFFDFHDDTISNNQHISEVAHVLRRNLPLYNGIKGPTSLL